MTITPSGEVADLDPEQMQGHILDTLSRTDSRMLPGLRRQTAEQVEQGIEEFRKQINNKNRLGDCIRAICSLDSGQFLPGDMGGQVVYTGRRTDCSRRSSI
jgi:hypothetical protein